MTHDLTSFTPQACTVSTQSPVAGGRAGTVSHASEAAAGGDTVPASGDAPAVTLQAEGEVSLVHTNDETIVRDLLSRRFIVLDVENLMETNVTVALFFWSASAAMDQPEMHATLGTFPGLPTRLTFDLRHLDGQQLFLDRTPGRLKGMARGAGIQPEQVARLGVGIVRSEPGARLRVNALWAQDEEPDYPLPDITLVDELGQWKNREWPGKTHGMGELTEYLSGEVAHADSTSPAEQGRSSWGGIVIEEALPGAAAAAPAAASSEPASGLPAAGAGGGRFEATGFFRVDHDGRRYFLVDPDGYPFYSLGLDAIREGITARVDGIEPLFEWLPDRGGEYADLWHEGPRRFPSVTTFDYLGANLRRALGADWLEKWSRLTDRRLRDWHFNTIGNWSSPAFIRNSTLPYVLPLSGSIQTSTPIFRDFPDVFSDEFAEAAGRHARQLEDYRGDRRLVGYFIMNEPHWAFENELNVAEKLLANPAELASKDALLEFLSERYGGNAGKLAEAWKLPELESFAELRRPLTGAASRSEAAARDLDEFNTILIKRFARIPCEAAKAVDPDHLNLGMRYAWISQPALYETGEYFDVFSINRYAPTAREQVDAVGERSGKPVMIGEFHHGALDAGLPSNGIRGVRTQKERAEAYRFYVETTAASPWSVGVHYFTLNDQAILGRFDGENFQIGLVDICQRPYAQFVSGVRETNQNLPAVLYGTREPTEYYPPEVTVGF